VDIELRVPLTIRTERQHRAVVRTILAIDEAADCMTFAGDIPEGCHARLMKANFDRLVDGAIGAAKISHEAVGGRADFALLISCVGRKAGFYSYGEISPFTPNARCELHNQTMTITTLSER
jgi:hypothetical protein